MHERRYPENPVLLVDDEAAVVTGMTLTLESQGFSNTLGVSDSREVLPLLEKQEVSTVLLDLSMPHLSGEEILQEVTARYPHLPVIVVTGHNDIDTAIRCMKGGAFDYLVKPVQETRLLSALRRALELRELRDEYASFREKVFSGRLDNPDVFAPFITADDKIHSLFRYIETISSSSRAVLITGETGVGKEIIARIIHILSDRPGEFVAVNVAALDDTVFSDALFGHVKGAFTGADKARPGLVERAAGGTLFLDEIGELEMKSQVKLLRLLQENEYHPVGADAARFSDARILVATNRSLEKMQAESRFRSDLYFRLQTHTVFIPPLRERVGDIPPLLNHFLAKAAADLDKGVPTPPRELVTLLAGYHFPGNVRELEAMVFDGVSHHTSRMLSMDSFKAHIRKHRIQAPEDLSSSAETSNLKTDGAPFEGCATLPTLAEAQVLLIEEALARAGGNQTLAAEMLGISRSGLSKAIKRKNIR